MKFDVLTLFPKGITSYFDQGLLNRAQGKGLIEINIHDLRNWSVDRHRTVDDKPYGGGNGMVLKVEPIYRAVKELKGRKRKTRTILLTPRGRKFDQKIAEEYSKLNQLIIISGRYEGVDERVAEYIADDQISIGPYVLMSGDLPAMVIIETIARLETGVAGDQEWLTERTNRGGFWEGPQYTRPEIFSPNKKEKWIVPKCLIGGNHREIFDWREEHGRIIESS